MKKSKFFIWCMSIFTICYLLCNTLNTFADSIHPLDYLSPDFGFSKEYECTFTSLYSTVSLPLMPPQNITPEEYLEKDAEAWKNVRSVWSLIEEESQIDDLIKNSPIVLIIKPVWCDSSLRYLPGIQYTKHIDGTVSPDNGMTLTECIVTKVCRNSTSAAIEEEQRVWIKEDYFTYTNEQGTTMLYAPEGSDLNPIEYESLVFCSINTEATKTLVLDVHSIHFTVNGPIGKYAEDAPHRAFTNIYSSEERLWNKYGEKVSRFFGVKINPYYKRSAPAIVYILSGVGIGMLICIAPVICIATVRRRKKKTQTEGQPPEPPEGNTPSGDPPPAPNATGV